MKTLTALLLLSLYATNLGVGAKEPSPDPVVKVLNVRQNETWFTPRQKPFSKVVGDTLYVQWAHTEPESWPK